MKPRETALARAERSVRVARVLELKAGAMVQVIDGSLPVDHYGGRHTWATIRATIEAGDPLAVVAMDVRVVGVVVRFTRDRSNVFVNTDRGHRRWLESPRPPPANPEK